MNLTLRITDPVLRISIAIAGLLVLLAGCAVNAVTGERELRLIGEGQERAIGQQQYGPAQQMQGGVYQTDPELSAYVSRVGQQVAAQARRSFEWQFVVLDNGVPNAWALPGGKIALNRGLLTELKDEAELAAVLAHEVVHADAGHGARAVSRGMLAQGALLAVAALSSDSNWAPVVVGGAQLAAQLVTTRYGRDAERESDAYGMRYMRDAGYDPAAAVSLQETFVRLSEGRQHNWLAGLFASHPPSAERVQNNQALLATLEPGGNRGADAYQLATADLRQLKPVLDMADEAALALADGRADAAEGIARKALAAAPKVAKLHELQGDIRHARGDDLGAQKSYGQAIELSAGGYFSPLLKRGLLRFDARQFDAARSDLERSAELLPVAPGSLALGRIAERQGQIDAALAYYEQAAGGGGDVGNEAQVARARLDLGRNPQRYLSVALLLEEPGAMVVNRSPVTVRRFSIAYIYAATGQQQGYEQPYTVTLAPGQQVRVALPRMQAAPVAARVASAAP